eukprot:scaffold1066_cov177-Skeletonema_marinoi.AAC.3
MVRRRFRLASEGHWQGHSQGHSEGHSQGHSERQWTEMGTAFLRWIAKMRPLGAVRVKLALNTLKASSHRGSS